jgi:hypothetical protein
MEKPERVANGIIDRRVSESSKQARVTMIIESNLEAGNTSQLRIASAVDRQSRANPSGRGAAEA